MVRTRNHVWNAIKWAQIVRTEWNGQRLMVFYTNNCVNGQNTHNYLYIYTVYDLVRTKVYWRNFYTKTMCYIKISIKHFVNQSNILVFLQNVLVEIFLYYLVFPPVSWMTNFFFISFANYIQYLIYCQYKSADSLFIEWTANPHVWSVIWSVDIQTYSAFAYQSTRICFFFS